MFRFVRNRVSQGQDPVQIIKENKFCKDIFDYMQQKREKTNHIFKLHTLLISISSWKSMAIQSER